jgi:hypothetical protein
VKRELTIPSGNKDQAGRLDLVIRYGNTAIIVVEVKKFDAESADLPKQEGYKTWLDEQQDVPDKNKKKVLLATASEMAVTQGGFDFRSWESVCRMLRRMAMDGLFPDKTPQVAIALILAFVGAVEQNLLGFSPVLLRRIVHTDERRLPIFNTSIVDYLERALSKLPEAPVEEEKIVHPGYDQSRLPLLEEGARSYLDALTALTEFQREIRSRWRHTLDTHFREYSEALGVQLRADEILPYASPERELQGAKAGLGLKLNISASNAVTCGSYYVVGWELNPDSSVRFDAWVSMYFSRQDYCKPLPAAVRSFKPEVPVGLELDQDKNNLWLSTRLIPEEMSSFDEKLGGVMHTWIQFWKRIGGLKVLFTTQV